MYFKTKLANKVNPLRVGTHSKNKALAEVDGEVTGGGHGSVSSAAETLILSGMTGGRPLKTDKNENRIN